MSPRDITTLAGEPMEAGFASEAYRLLVFALRYRTVKGRVLSGPVSGSVLGHDIDVRVGRYLVCNEPDDLSRPCEPFGQHQMPDEKAAPGDAVFVDLEIPHLTVHLL